MGGHRGISSFEEVWIKRGERGGWCSVVHGYLGSCQNHGSRFCFEPRREVRIRSDVAASVGLTARNATLSHSHCGHVQRMIERVSLLCLSG